MALKVPLVNTTPPDEFGVAIDAALVNTAVTGQSVGATYVPGFSDMRMQRDREISEVVSGKRAAKDVSTLPVNVRWSRNARRDGTPDSSKVFSAGRKGYRIVTKADVGQPWLKEIPAGAQIAADGSIRNQDCVLTVATKEQAAANAMAKTIRTRQRLEGAQANFESEVARRGGNRGGAPTIERSLGEPIAAKK